MYVGPAVRNCAVESETEKNQNAFGLRYTQVCFISVINLLQTSMSEKCQMYVAELFYGVQATYFYFCYVTKYSTSSVTTSVL